VWCVGGAGKGKERRLLTAPEPTQRITYHPHSTPLHKIKTDNMLPSQLLTPFQVSAPACMQPCLPDMQLLRYMRNGLAEFCIAEICIAEWNTYTPGIFSDRD